MATTKAITVSDLKDQIGALGPQPILFCDECGGSEESANRGDYFAVRNQQTGATTLHIILIISLGSTNVMFRCGLRTNELCTRM